MKKWTKSANFGNFGVLRRGIGIPHSGVAERGRFGKPWVCRGVAKICRSEVLRCSVAIVHSMEIFLFCFVLLFCYSEDLSIGLMRTL